MARDNRAEPPDRWFPGAFAITEDVYAAVMDDPPAHSTPDNGGGRVIVWHWCPKREAWDGAFCPLHTLTSVEPLHLEPSLVCPDPPGCGWHGWLHNGEWVPV